MLHMSAPKLAAFPSWAFLLVGIALRCVAINQPLIDAHLYRQTQTADAVRSLIRAPHWELSSRPSWLGDTNARLVQEFPLYNFLVVGVYRIVGNLDVSGKLASILLWAVSFLFLQAIWKRLLTPGQTLWANLLFVVSPLSIFFGQAFMPEMLIRACEFAFLALLLTYCENGRFAILLMAAAVGATGMIVKAPEFFHLYFVAGFLLFQKEGWAVLRRPGYWLILIATGICMKAWASYVDSTNATGVPEWSATATATAFLGKWTDRLSLHPYIKYAGYLTALTFTPAGLLVALFGSGRVGKQPSRYAVLVAWAFSVAAFYLLWGPRTAGEHSYYHLPALGVACALFGVGADWLLELAARHWPGRWGTRTTALAIVVSVIGPGAAATAYLFRQDRVIYDAALWVRDHVPRNEMVLFVLNHRPELDYAHVPVFSYYADRNVWVYSRTVPEERMIRALKSSVWAVVTRAPDEGDVGRLRRLLRGGEKPLQPQDVSWLEQKAGFKRDLETAEFIVYKKLQPAGG